MNSLSWLIYAGATAGSLSHFLLFVSTISAIAAVVLVLAYAFNVSEMNEGYNANNDGTLNQRGERHVRYAKTCLSLFKRSLAVCIASSVLAVVIPSRDVVYAIAASEVGERVVQNETVKGVALDTAKALQEWIKSQAPKKSEAK